MKTRIRFTKTGPMKFIGHLDCMRFFQKAIRRAKLDVAYSQGYSPHQLMSFASPLGVGVTSDGEYLDVEFHELPNISLYELVVHLNQFMTDDIFVTKIEIMPDDFKNSMALLCAADYMIIEKEKNVFPPDWVSKWGTFVNQEQIMVLKKTKKSEKLLDIKPYILAWAYTAEDMEQQTGERYRPMYCEYTTGDKLFMQLTSGSETNIKPELVMNAFYTYCNAEYRPYSYQVHRLQMHFKSKRGTGNEPS